MKFRYTDTALAEIDEICSHIEQDNPIAAADVAAAIERTVAWIAERWNWAPIVYKGKVQAKLVERFHYRIYYEVEAREVIVRNVRRTNRLRPWERERQGIDDRDAGRE
jgi:plasmid stabilization system protein ParE